MLTVIRHSLTRYIGQILGWGIALALVGTYAVLLYDTLVKPGVQQQYQQLISSYPPELMAFFGDTSQMFTPGGYLDTLFFSYMSIVVAIFAIMAGASMLAGDEEKGILDLVLAHPISRAKLLFARLGAFTAATILILFIAWLGFILPLSKTTMNVTSMEILLPFISLFGLLLFIGTLTLLLSMLLPSQQWAAMICGIILVASYFLSSLSKLSENLRPVEKYFPMHYYQGGRALTGMNWGWFGILIAFSIVFTGLAWWLFERRDIRVSGESGWRMSTSFSRKVNRPVKSICDLVRIQEL
jgi:ABC-2 type transport system permease protein